MRTVQLFSILLLSVAIPLAAGQACIDERHYDGGHAEYPANWDQPLNWNPDEAPLLNSHVYIAFGSPYVAVTGTLCQAYAVTLQSGGKLVLRKADDGKTLGIVTHLVVQAGATFGIAGSAGANGPIVAIGGNITNHGVIDLRGVSTGHEQVILAGINQTIGGTREVIFQNLRSFATFTVDGIDVYVVGTYNGPWPNEINGGRFILGEPALPITLAYFHAAFHASASGVAVEWRTLSEVDNYGFYVERRAADAADFETVCFVPTQGNGIVPHDYSYTDAGVRPGSWYYRLRQVDLTGDQSVTDAVLVEILGVTAVDDIAVPAAFALLQNYPNPFNPETAIRFSVDGAGPARLVVYDAVGREVATVFDGLAEPGRQYTVTFGGADRASGTYFYRLEGAGKTDMKRMVLMK